MIADAGARPGQSRLRRRQAMTARALFFEAVASVARPVATDDLE
jgi:hypothetical protein